MDISTGIVPPADLPTRTSFAPPGLCAALLALLVAAGVLLAGAAPASAGGGGYACVHHGDKKPGELRTKQARNAVICLINKQRRANGRGGLDANSKLNEAARKHSKTMRTKGCFSHQCSGEKSLEGRLKAAGYLHGGLNRWAYGENIANGRRGKGTPRAAVRAWMRSSSHRSHILSRTFEDVGVGFDRNTSKGYYTADFGLRQG